MTRSTPATRFAALAVAALLTACGGRGDPAPPAGGGSSQGAVPPAAESLPNVLATIDGESITMDDIRLIAGADLEKMESMYLQQRHDLVDGALRQILRERVLLAEAQKQGVTLDALVMQEAGGSLEPTEVEVAAWYQENQSRVRGRSLDQLRPQIAQLLRNERGEAAAKALERRLYAERGVQVLLAPYRVPLDNAGAPAKGPSDAKVELTEFSDFECPFCAQFFPTLKRIEAEYGDRVRIVYRQYPLTNIHPKAFKAAEASLCAHEQGKFWEMHDLLFQEQNAMDVRDLKVKAGRLRMNQGDFDRCLDTGRFVEQVQNDLAAGSAIGVGGTPALFVNGIPLPGGAVPFEAVAAVLDEELARASE